jgi:hypothetical protein
MMWISRHSLRPGCYGLVLLLLGPIYAAAQKLPATGAVFLDPKDYKNLPVAPIPTSGNIPESATLEQYFPAAGNQGGLGSCTAWSTSYFKAYRIYQAYRDLNSADKTLKPQDFLQSPEFVYSALTKENCSKGIPISYALDFLHDTGSVFWADLPYTDQSCPSWKAVESRAVNKSRRYKRIDDNPDHVLSDIKNFIANGDPVVLAIYACSELLSPPPLITKAEGDNSDSVACGAHAILAVGYDEHLKAIRLLNSWGTNWGNDGKVWISYDVLMRRFREGYVDFGPEAEDVSLPHTVPSLAELTPEVLVNALRANISPQELATIKYYGETESVHPWSIWLNLPEQFRGTLASVDYYFLHPTFRNPKHSEPGSSIFLAQWKGWGCIDEAYLIAKTKSGHQIRADFDFCEVVNGNVSGSRR